MSQDLSVPPGATDVSDSNVPPGATDVDQTSPPGSTDIPKVPTALDGFKHSAGRLIAHATMAALKATGPVSESVEKEFDHQEEVDRLTRHAHETAINMGIKPSDEQHEVNPAVTAMGPSAVKGLRAYQAVIDASDPAIQRAAQFGKMADKPLADRILIAKHGGEMDDPFAKSAIAPNPSSRELLAPFSKTVGDVKRLMSNLQQSMVAYERPGYASASNDDPSQFGRAEDQAGRSALTKISALRGPADEPLSDEEKAHNADPVGKAKRLANATADLINAGFGSVINGPAHPGVQAAMRRVKDYTDTAEAEDVSDMANTAMMIFGAGEGVHEVGENWEAAKDLPGWAAEAYVPDRLQKAIYQARGGTTALTVMPDESVYNIWKSLGSEVPGVDSPEQNLMIHMNPQMKRIRGAMERGEFPPKEIPITPKAVTDQALGAAVLGPEAAELAEKYKSLYAVAAKGAKVPQAVSAQFGQVMGDLSRTVGNGPMLDMIGKGYFQGKFSRIDLAKLDSALEDAALKDAGAHPQTMSQNKADLHTANTQSPEAATLHTVQKEAEDAAVAARKKNSDDVWRIAQAEKKRLEAAPEPAPEAPEPPKPAVPPTPESVIEKVEDGAEPEQAIQQHEDEKDAVYKKNSELHSVLRRVTPAIKAKDGQIFTDTRGHDQILEDHPEAKGGEEGFKDGYTEEEARPDPSDTGRGQFITREEAKEKYGFTHTDQLDEMREQAWKHSRAPAPWESEESPADMRARLIAEHSIPGKDIPEGNPQDLSKETYIAGAGYGKKLPKNDSARLAQFEKYLPAEEKDVARNIKWYDDIVSKIPESIDDELNRMGVRGYGNDLGSQAEAVRNHIARGKAHVAAMKAEIARLKGEKPPNTPAETKPTEEENPYKDAVAPARKGEGAPTKQDNKDYQKELAKDEEQLKRLILEQDAFESEGKDKQAELTKKGIDDIYADVQDRAGQKIYDIMKSRVDAHLAEKLDEGYAAGNELGRQKLQSEAVQPTIDFFKDHQFSEKGIPKSYLPVLRAAGITTKEGGLSLKEGLSLKGMKDINDLVDAIDKEVAAPKTETAPEDRIKSHEEAIEAKTREIDGLQRELDTLKSEQEQGKAKLIPSEEPEETGGAEADAPQGGPPAAPPETPTEHIPSKREWEMPLEMPELVSLVKDLIGKYPQIVKSMGDKQGAFYPDPNNPRIKIRADLFANIDQAAKTLAHELGHADDFFPDKTMAHGNLVGRILNLKKYLKDSFPGFDATNSALKKELIALSKFWRPWDRDVATPNYIKYRDASKELFADAVSVFLNSPGTLEKMAPKFFKAFTGEMDRKPDFKVAWLDIQDLLYGERDRLLEKRRRDIREMGMKTDDILIRKEAEKGRQIQSIGDQAAQHLLDRFYPDMKLANSMEANGQIIPDEYNPKYVYQEGDMLPEAKATMDLALDRILNPLLTDHGIGQVELHEYGFSNRILHDRSNIGNPLGFDPKSAQENLDYLRRSLGDTKYAALVKAFNAIQDIYWPIYEEAHNLGVIGNELWNTTILPNKGNYVSFAVQEYLEKAGYVSAGIKSQIGTFKEIADTFIATRLKVQAIMARNLDQKNKLTHKYLWDTEHPGEMTKTEIIRTGDGPGIERPGVVEGTNIRKAVLRIYEDGRLVAYDVDPYIAEMFEKMKPAQMSLIHRVMSIPNAPIRLMYTAWNMGFVFGISPLRYLQKTYKGLSDVNGGKGVSVAELLAEYVKAIPTSLSHATGNPNALARALLRDHILQVTSLTEMDLAPELSSYATKLKKYQLQQDGEKDHGLGHRILEKVIMPMRQFAHAMQITADTMTGAWKVAAATIRWRAGEGGPEMAYNVRNYAGIPYSRTRGLSAQTTNDLFLFANIQQRHYMTALQVLTNPKSRGGARMKTAVMDVLPALLQAFAELGLLGVSLQQFYKRMSKYDKRHTTIVPLGSMPGGKWKWKSVGMPIPHDDMGRIVHALTYEAVMGMARKDPKQVAAMFGEIYNLIPSESPAIQIPKAWLQEYTGGRYFDQYLQRTAIPDRIEKIGGLMKLEKMVEWTTNSLGMSNFASYDPASRSTTEMFCQMMPWVNRLLKISDYGMEEDFKEKMDGVPGAARIYALQEKKHSQAGVLGPRDAQELARLNHGARVYRNQLRRETKQEQTPKGELRRQAREKLNETP